MSEGLAADTAVPEGQQRSPRHIIPWPPKPYSYMMTVAYDGTDFDGYQMQADADSSAPRGSPRARQRTSKRNRQQAGRRTVQMELHGALSTRLNVPWDTLRLWVCHSGPLTTSTATPHPTCLNLRASTWTIVEQSSSAWHACQWAALLTARAIAQVAGRTDKGVHANGQAVQFHLDKPLPEPTLKNLYKGLNSLLPRDVRVTSVCRTPPDFSVQVSALSREYHYHLAWGEVEDPLRRRVCAFHSGHLDVGAMVAATKLFEGRHNFDAFSSKPRVPRSAGTVRQLFRAECVQVAPGEVRFEVCSAWHYFLCQM